MCHILSPLSLSFFTALYIIIHSAANINLNKLDAAFDIDPLFHKMSKSFDEGGAKGLLLVNLGVGERGCNIVFDSSSSGDAAEKKKKKKNHPPKRASRKVPWT